MKIVDACQSIPRIQITHPNTHQWSWGTGFWATDGSKTRLVTASHLWDHIGGRSDAVALEIELPDKSTLFEQSVSVEYRGRDLALLDVKIPAGIISFQINSTLAHERALVVGIGYGCSLNQPDGSQTPLRTPINIMLNRGRIDAVQSLAGDELIEVITMSEPGFSGGPLFYAATVSGSVAVEIDDQCDDRQIASLGVVGLCRGCLSSNRDRVGYEPLSNF